MFVLFKVTVQAELNPNSVALLIENDNLKFMFTAPNFLMWCIQGGMIW